MENVYTLSMHEVKEAQDCPISPKNALSSPQMARKSRKPNKPNEIKIFKIVNVY
jgi:hypothetical protein